jgi:signal transduction histidine kinase
MTAAFTGMSAYKAFFLLPQSDSHTETGGVHWLMQMANILVIAGTVQAILDLTDGLRARNAELEAANEELAARDEEITRQNEELQTQSEEVTQQNEELQQQAEEVRQQSEEMKAQTEELQTLNTELRQRESALQAILESLGGGGEEALDGICRSSLEIFGDRARAAAVVVRSGDRLITRARAGLTGAGEEPVPFLRSFAAIVMEQERTAYVDDLAKRPDLLVRRPAGVSFRSVLAAPIRLAGAPAGAVEVYAAAPRQWTVEEFRVVEWVAAQASLVLEARRLTEELSKTNASLEETVASRTRQLQRLVEELEHFSYTITHDMRAPLRAMRGFAEILAAEHDAMPEERRKDFLGRIVTAAGRMDRLITDALAYSKVGRHELPLNPVDPSSLLKGMLESYPEFQPPRALIQVEGPLPAVLANEAGLTQCFSNLLGNAVKFIEPGKKPEVRIRAERLSDDLVRIWFEDNGIGVPAEMQPRIFGMFQRASKAFDGTGIGLALVKKVIDRMEGRVGVESSGQGSRFWLELKAAGKDS